MLKFGFFKSYSRVITPMGMFGISYNPRQWKISFYSRMFYNFQLGPFWAVINK